MHSFILYLNLESTDRQYWFSHLVAHSLQLDSYLKRRSWKSAAAWQTQASILSGQLALMEMREAKGF